MSERIPTPRPEASIDELRALRAEKIKKILAEDPARDIFGEIAEFTESLAARYPTLTLHDYELFHVLVGSSAHDVPYHDLPGGECATFIRETL